MTGGFIVRNGWWKTLTIADMNLKSRGVQFEHITRLCLALLLIGHGGLALFNDHPVLIKHFTYFGIPTHGLEMRVFGGFRKNGRLHTTNSLSCVLFEGAIQQTTKQIKKQ